jgi:hypothetical protein
LLAVNLEEVPVLRPAFESTIEDKNYQAVAEKSKLTSVNSGRKINRYVAQIYSISPQVAKRLEFLARKPRTS